MPKLQALIEVKNLSFNRGERVIYDNVSLQIRRGQITAIMGPSGTGKTTLLRLIGGQLTPDSGEVLLDGKNIASMSRGELLPRVRVWVCYFKVVHSLQT